MLKKVYEKEKFQVILLDDPLTPMDTCLFDAKNLLDKLQIPFYLCTGTALGFNREGTFIPHDYDIDIAVDAAHFKPEIITEFLESGKFSKSAFRKIKDHYVELSFNHNSSNIRIDIFITYLDGDNPFNVLWDFNRNYSTGDGNPILMYYTGPHQFITINYKGATFLSPDEEYLRQTYGDTWKTPIDFKKIGGDPYLASLTTHYRPCLLDVANSHRVIEKVLME